MGDWTLEIVDVFPTSGGGTLQGWCLNFVGDVAGVPWLRGDVDGNSQFNGLLDGLFILNFSFVPGSPTPPCLAQADADSSGDINGILDGLFILNFAFVAGSPPIQAPYPGCDGNVVVDSPISCDTPACP